MSSSVTPGSSDVARLQALQQLSWVDAPPDVTLDQLVELAAWTFNVPMVTLSLFDDPHVVHKAHAGLPSDALAQPLGLGMQDIVGKGFLVVSDARSQPSMSDHPWVTGSQGVRFFASVALTTADGHNVGALSVMDTHVRELSDHEARILTAMARLAMDHMSLQTSVRHMAALNAELEQAHGWLLESVAQDSLTQVANRRALMSFIEGSGNAFVRQPCMEFET
jgi:GAF domain-containing protein